MLIIPLLLLCFRASADVTTAPGLAGQLDAIAVDAFPADAPGAAVLVVLEGKPVLHKGYGLANVEKHQPIKPDDIFRIGSITKQFTAVAVLQLVQQGKVKLDDPITLYVSDFDMRGKTITIENLLTHTSGIPGYTEMPDFDSRKFETLAPRQIVATTDGKPLLFDPGTKFRYSNTNYALLGMVIEKASGQTYADYLLERIAKPAGLKDTRYSLNDAASPRHAIGYDSQSEPAKPAKLPNMSQPYAAGAIESTVDDLWAWTAALRDGKLADAKLLERAWTPFSPSDGKSNYGYGWGIRTQPGERWISHGGGIDGFSSSAIFVPEKNLFVAVLSNKIGGSGESPDPVARRLALAALGRPEKTRTAITLDEKTLEKYVGVYEFSPTFKMNITREGQRLFGQATNQGKAELFAEAEGKFFAKVVNAQFEFKMNGDRAESLVLHQGGRDVPAKRVSE